MRSIAAALTPRRYQAVTDRSAADDFWYGAVGSRSLTGIDVTPDSALKISAVWACVLLLSETIASLPLIVYARQPDGGKQRATWHPLYDLLHSRPNRLQTSFGFFQQMTTHNLLRGDAYARIVPGPRGPVDQLIPLHPDRVTTEQVARDAMRYRYRAPTGGEEVLADDQVLHLQGLTLDGVHGLSVISHARETLGLALAAESYAARVFSQDASPRGVLTHPGRLSDKAAERLRLEWAAKHAGLGNAHSTAVLEEGMRWESIGMTNEDAQLLASRDFSVEDVARWFRVPLHMISSTTKATSWGSGIEQLSQGFVTYTLLPWLRRWEQAISRDLILEPETYYAEFLTDALLRGSTLDRYNAYAVGRQWGWLSVNDVRRRENQNPVPNGDRYLEPLNMQAPAAPPSRPAATARYAVLLTDLAGRVLRREVTALGRLAKRTAGDVTAWSAGLEEFYTEHAGYVAETLRVERSQAVSWCAAQRERALALGAAGLEEMELTRLSDLVALALGEEDDA